MFMNSLSRKTAIQVTRDQDLNPIGFAAERVFFTQPDRLLFSGEGRRFGIGFRARDIHSLILFRLVDSKQHQKKE